MIDQPHRRRPLGLAIAATSLGFVVVQLDVSIVNVALDSMGKSLHTGLGALSWIVDAYTLAFAAGLLSGGALGDRLGARKVYVAGLILFTAASLACGLSPDAGWLIAARAAQGVGAALLLPCSLALLTHACGDDSRARAHAVGLWTASGSVSLSAGPLIGGALVGAAGWPSIFLVNLPVGAAGLWMALRFLDETPRGEGAIDVAGPLLAAIALFAAVGAVIELGEGGVGALTIAGGAVALVAGAAFLTAEHLQAAPMLPLGLFADPDFSIATAVGFCVNFVLYGALFLLGLYFQHMRHESPVETGIAFLPLMASVGVANVVAGRLAGRAGPRLPIAAGLACAAAGFAATAALGPQVSQLVLTLALLPIFLGVGLAVPAMTAALLSAVPREKSGVASGVLNTVRQAAGAAGVAAFGAVSASGAETGLRLAFFGSAALCVATVALVAVGMSKAGSGGG